jgi:hypothetical protein
MGDLILLSQSTLHYGDGLINSLFNASRIFTPGRGEERLSTPAALNLFGHGPN